MRSAREDERRSDALRDEAPHRSAVPDLEPTLVSAHAGRTWDALRSLLAPGSGMFGLCVRFVLAGGLNTIVYLLVTLLAADVARLPFQAALVIGFGTAVSVNFFSQRRFVWAKSEQYHLPAHHQAGRFLLWAGAQYGATAAATLALPPALGMPTQAVYVGVIALLAVVNFLVMRYAIFHSRAL